jgi:acid phosphatase (class A)
MALLLLSGATPVLGVSDTPYLVPGDIDITALLPPPPRLHSAAEDRDVAEVMAAQGTRTPAQAARAEADAKVDIFRFADVLGPQFLPDHVPLTAAFLRKVRRETGAVMNIAKDCWERPRPFVVDGALHPPGTIGEDTRNPSGADNGPHAARGPGSPCAPLQPKPAYTYSYPSGHSTFGVTTAILLAAMVPEKREELFARGWEYGHNRVIGGVHFPTDVEAGRIEATAMVALMMRNEGFKQDLAAAKAELRQALGLMP